MKARDISAWLFVVFLIVGCHPAAQGSGPGLPPNPSVHAARHSLEMTKAVLGELRISVLAMDAWRDWMPIVEKPGPDGGSPLRAKVRLLLDNSAGKAKKLSLNASVVDEKGRRHATGFKSLTANGVEWNGELGQGETKTVELSTTEGPYVPVGANVRVGVTVTDQSGDSVVVQTAESTVYRTD